MHRAEGMSGNKTVIYYRSLQVLILNPQNKQTEAFASVFVLVRITGLEPARSRKSRVPRIASHLV